MAAGIFILASCNKRSTAAAETICTIAKVHYGGDPRADGAGWVLVIDSVTKKTETPDNLDEMYKREGLMLDVCYRISDKTVPCFCSNPPKMIHITSVNKL